MKTINLSQRAERFVFIAICILTFIGLVAVVYYRLPVNPDVDSELNIGVDWKGAFRPSIHQIISGQNPYGGGSYNPPWSFIPFIPIAFLSPALGSAVMFVLGLYMFAYAAYRMGAKPWLIILFLFSQPVLGNSANGNFDWLVALGCTLPPQIGLFLVSTKPQLGIGIAIFWAIEAWQKGKIKEVLRVFSPVAIAFIISFLIYGPYLFVPSMVENNWNLSLWPIGIAIGIPMLVSAIRKKNAGLAISSSPFLAPYVSGHGWSMALFGLLQQPLECAAAILSMWLIRIIM